MKKRYLLFLLLIFILLPVKARGYDIDKFYMDITVADNGDIHIKELFKLNGDYNGFERIIINKNSTMSFDGTLESYENSSIYNGDNVRILQVKGIPFSNEYDFKTMNEKGNQFINEFANIGEYGKYTIDKKDFGTILEIYNPSNYKNYFYIEYIIENVVVVHNDVAEIYFNIFSDEMRESIKELVVNVNLPKESKEVLIWAHGPYSGEIDLVSKKLVQLKVPKLNANTPVDYRIVFDKNLIERSSKTTSENAKEMILKVEKKRADDANKQRQKEDRQLYSFYALSVLWFFGTIISVYFYYQKYDKEHISSFKTRYYRDFPREYGPEIVSYLTHRYVLEKDLSASVLNLIAKKNLGYEGKDDYTLVLKNEDNMSESEIFIINWFVKEIGENNKVSMKQINKAAKNYIAFSSNYDKWKKIVEKEAEKEQFFEKRQGSFKYYLFPLMGLLLMLYPYATTMVWTIGILSLLIIFYFAISKKRSVKGNEEYRMWMGLKNFLSDFGKFKERDLPHIELWEKYLVYAMSFGIANKLSKTMQIKFKEMQNSGMITPTDYIYLNTFDNLNILSNSIGNSINSSVRSAQAARTRASSGSGLGGGFSGGGGFGGGGGGGGRF